MTDADRARMNRLLAEAFVHFGWTPEDMSRLLHGDPSAIKPVGILNATALRSCKEPWKKA